MLYYLALGYTGIVFVLTTIMSIGALVLAGTKLLFIAATFGLALDPVNQKSIFFLMFIFSIASSVLAIVAGYKVLIGVKNRELNWYWIFTLVASISVLFLSSLCTEYGQFGSSDQMCIEENVDQFDMLISSMFLTLPIVLYAFFQRKNTTSSTQPNGSP